MKWLWARVFFSGLKCRIFFEKYSLIFTYSVWFGSFSVTVNIWHGVKAIWDLELSEVCIAYPDSQALHYKTGFLPSVFYCYVLRGCIVCCSLCISCCLNAYSVSCRLTKWEVLCLIHCWFFTVCLFWSAHCSHLNYISVQLRQCSVSKWLLECSL